MRGFPKHLNTKQDCQYIQKNFPKNQWKPVLQKILDGRFEWLNTKTLKLEEVGIADETHRVTEVKDETEKIIEKYQQEYKEDPNAKLFKIGFTVSEMTDLLKSQEPALQEV